MSLKDKGRLPVLVRRTACTLVVSPMLVSPKLTDAVDKVATGAPMAVPVRFRTSGDSLVPLCARDSVALRGPGVPVGVKRT